MDYKNIKCVMVIDKELPLGLIANTAAILGCSLNHYVKNIVGNETYDKDNVMHKGLIQIPLPVLSSSRDEIKKLYDDLSKNHSDEVIVIDFNDVAQKCKDYEDYIKRLSCTYSGELNYLGICIYGSKKVINKATGSLH